MARFYGSVINRRGKSYGHVLPGSVALAGWDAGVKVTPHVGADGKDEFHVYTTGGSHDEHGEQLIGIVRDTGHGPEFQPGALAVRAVEAEQEPASV